MYIRLGCLSLPCMAIGISFMRNQYPLCTRERTMKARTKTIFTVCFAMVIFKSISASVEISSQVELDSDENEVTLSNSALDETVNLNRSANPSESVLRTSKQPLFSWRRRSELVKSSEPRIYTSHDDSSSRSKVINNIQIVVNSDDSVSNANSCKQGVCNVSVSSRSDGKGNIVTEVYLSIITSAKPSVQVDDVPIIDGFRGVNEDQNEQPTLHLINMSNSAHSHLHRDNIPQIQSNYRGYGEPWYQLRRTLQRPQTYWNYHHFDDYGNVRFRAHETWPRDRPIVDDKIEPPLSKTKARNDVKS